MAWDELLSIAQVARVERQQARDTPPTACPYDGEPLKTVPDTGVLRCPADGWEWDGSPVDW